jgi:RNA polymerase sigma factor (TIGR02999 family)
VAGRSDITAMLLAWGEGDEAAKRRLIERVYQELRRIARRHLRRERVDHSLSPTALVHEAYLKLVDQRGAGWRSRAHFFSLAAHLMRRILVDHARARAAAKRPRADTLALEDVDPGTPPLDLDVLALDAALERLERKDPRHSQVVELRFFAGLSVEETAVALDVAPITVKRDWALARAWLFRELRRQAS